VVTFGAGRFEGLKSAEFRGGLFSVFGKVENGAFRRSSRKIDRINRRNKATSGKGFMRLGTGIAPLDRIVSLEEGKMTLLEGLPALWLSHLFSVRAQLGAEEGGIGSPVLWLDGGNTFNPYLVVELSKRLGLEPRRTLEGVHISRAFTCYQMSSLVMEKLRPALGESRAKLLVISDLPYLYTEPDIPKREAEKAFRPVLEKLEVMKAETFLLVTNLAPLEGRICSTLREAADVVVRVRKKVRGFEARLLKPGGGPSITFTLPWFDLPTLEEFFGDVVGQDGSELQASA
jgi:hypothetical protein